MGTQPPLQQDMLWLTYLGLLILREPLYLHMVVRYQCLTPPMGPLWSVSGNIPNITDLLGVDLGNQFSIEADEWRGDRRRNPDRQARR